MSDDERRELLEKLFQKWMKESNPLDREKAKTFLKRETRSYGNNVYFHCVDEFIGLISDYESSVDEYHKKHHSASMMWRFDKSYSRLPTGKCEAAELGLYLCDKCENGYCYDKSPCASKKEQTSQKDIRVSANEAKRMVNECYRRNAEMMDIYERNMNAFDYDEILDMINRSTGFAGYIPQGHKDVTFDGGDNE